MSLSVTYTTGQLQKNTVLTVFTLSNAACVRQISKPHVELM